MERQGVHGRWREDEVTGAPEQAVGGRCQARRSSGPHRPVGRNTARPLRRGHLRPRSRSSLAAREDGPVVVFHPLVKAGPRLARQTRPRKPGDGASTRERQRGHGRGPGDRSRGRTARREVAVGAVDDALVFESRPGGLEVWEPRTGEVTRRLPGAAMGTTHRDLRRGATPRTRRSTPPMSSQAKRGPSPRPRASSPSTAGAVRSLPTAPCLPSRSRGGEDSRQSGRSPSWTWSGASPGRSRDRRSSLRTSTSPGCPPASPYSSAGESGTSAGSSSTESATSGRFPSRLRSETSMGWRPAQLRRRLRTVFDRAAGQGRDGSRARAASHKRRGSRARCDPTKTGRHARARAR